MSIPGSWTRAAAGAGLLAPDGEVAATIFSEMSALALRTGAVNLGQGFPDEDGPREILDAARDAIACGLNQYPPGPGFPVLREAIAAHQLRFGAIALDPDGEVLVTTGATEALAAALLALLEPGDEVVTFTPHYDAYGALIALARGVHRTVLLRGPSFAVDHDELIAAVTDRTRVILVNDPHNPTGAVLPAETRELIVRLAERHDAVIVTDEVYEHLRFDTPHVPLATLPGAFDRTLSISSAGKTFSTTGWKIGWVTGPRELITAVLAVKQFLTYVSGSPFQGAVALGLGLPDSFFTGVAQTLSVKKDLLSSGLAAAGFGVAGSSGGYFVVADAAPLGYDDGVALCRALPGLAGVVAVPVSAFCRPEDAAAYRSLVRFAFCKRFEVLEAAVAGLARMAR
ncbi:aminotransferase class V-fold PLP-dependent enzyme [Rathayibacter tritici]|uniref:Aminotransferase n=1 Tax=Rathayibacter tritici TaxID=33888 RepID=A0A160KRS7_9MICO|nr:aminotransferase class I/II-fold pyridoxal phosphate-dependent enzyme [Rathayibacter tritici]AND16019.1 aminotransferase [Rathayibacter tritici]PPF68659.1 aminotransferase class V-fold PLP-dependent enzyme [Rathayibacter tritici]PPG07375.1 aminotransferase class V-fold PLP-dependent enzyme [Rathayibacter tritici]PPI42001.1 aminotransferase class V-fold PLP-dependent enzyme [Rathayibacter tritici]